MTRYFKLYKTFVKNCLVREMEFRLNFIISTLLYFAWAGIGFATIFLIYGKVDAIAGWTRDEMLLLLLIFNILNAIYKTIFHRNLNGIPDQIRKGDLDFLLTKPANLRFLLSLRHTKFDQIPRLIVFIIILILFTPQVNPNLNVAHVMTSITLIIAALIAMQSFTFIIVCYAFWKPRVWNLFAIVGEILNISQYPSDIYRGAIQVIVQILPIALFGTIPALFLLGRGSTMLFVSSLFTTFAFYTLSTITLRSGVRQYESASS